MHKSVARKHRKHSLNIMLRIDLGVLPISTWLIGIKSSFHTRFLCKTSITSPWCLETQGQSYVYHLTLGIYTRLKWLTCNTYRHSTATPPCIGYFYLFILQIITVITLGSQVCLPYLPLLHIVYGCSATEHARVT